MPASDPAPATVVEYLARRFPHVDLDTWQRRAADGRISFDDGEEVTLSTAYRPGARVRYFRAVAREPRVPFRERVLYQDRHLLVADKPHFLPVTPGGPYVNECLLYRLRRTTGLDGLQPVHRLDRDTAGLVLFAVSGEARGRYGRLFLRGEVEKEYEAVARVPERPDRDVWEVENRIVRGEPWFRMTTAPGPSNASTRIELADWRGGHGTFRLWPRTGKKHQLRLHLAGLGFPILGDRYYPELEPEAPPDFSRPLRLVARQLRFRDPFSGDERRFRR